MRRIVEYLDNLRAPWLLAGAAAAVLSAVAVWMGGVNQDEGWYLYAAQMVHSGLLPYRDFFYTQGPAMPLVYSVLSPIWGMSSPLHGLLGGRVVTLALGLLATAGAVALVRRLVPPSRRSAAGLAVFALLACNIYHLYFTTIPKTYSLGSLFVMVGMLLLTCGLESCGRRRSAPLLFAGGLSLAFATGTRISLLLILPVAGMVLLLNFRTFRWSFVWLGLGAMLGGFLTYGLFALDPASLRTLLAAQNYHAARGGFDPFFAIGSVSRLVRGYAALGTMLLVGACLAVRAVRGGHADPVPGAEGGMPRCVRSVRWILGLGFAAVFLLQLSAPFPYDDYQVPLMGMLTVLLVAWCSDRTEGKGLAWFAVLVACMVSFASPQLQEWATYSQDRFWSQKKEMTELAKLRAMGREIETIDPGGTTLFTQDTYLAIETGRKVPRGMEMGPFCYFPNMGKDEARAVHVLNSELMEELLRSAPCTMAACSGYTFAIAVPKCDEVPFDDQMHFFELLKVNYELQDTETNFGQNATTLLLLKRREKAKEAGK